MAALGRSLLAVALCCVAKAKDLGGGWEEKTNPDGKVVQQLKIEAPSMTEEDQYGHTMPERYRCDGCKAVMWHLDKELRKRHPKNRKMKEWEFTDAFEETCRTAFDGYGIKLIDGENALSGPGLPREEKLAPGSGAIQMSSENWSKRLGEICRKLVFEKVGEEEMYERFHRRLAAEEAGKSEEEASSELGLSPELCMKDFRECKAGPKATPEKVEEKKEKKEKAKKEKAKADKKAKKETKDSRPKAADKAADQPEKIDAPTFLRSLAVKHGLTSDKYVASRTAAEWEKLFVSIAGKLFSEKSEL